MSTTGLDHHYCFVNKNKLEIILLDTLQNYHQATHINIIISIALSASVKFSTLCSSNFGSNLLRNFSSCLKGFQVLVSG